MDADLGFRIFKFSEDRDIWTVVGRMSPVDVDFRNFGEFVLMKVCNSGNLSDDPSMMSFDVVGVIPFIFTTGITTGCIPRLPVDLDLDSGDMDPTLEFPASVKDETPGD